MVGGQGRADSTVVLDFKTGATTVPPAWLPAAGLCARVSLFDGAAHLPLEPHSHDAVARVLTCRTPPNPPAPGLGFSAELN